MTIKRNAKDEREKIERERERERERESIFYKSRKKELRTKQNQKERITFVTLSIKMFDVCQTFRFKLL